MSEAPDVFDFFLGQTKGFGNVEVGGEGFDSRRTR